MKPSTSRLLAILLIIGGVFCILFPWATAVAAEIFVGVALLFAAVFTLLQLPYSSGAVGKVLCAVMFVLYLAASVFLLKNPLEGTLVLASAVGIIFLVESIFLFIAWGKLRKNKGAAFILLDGILTIILGAVMLASPGISMMLLGILVGLNLLFTGIASLVWTGVERKLEQMEL